MGMAERIKERRLALGYTQEELAAKLGLQKSAIAKYENGRVENIKRSIISKMADILECSPTYLMGWDEDFARTIHNSAFSLDSIYEVFGYELYALCDAYLTIRSKDRKRQLLSFADYLLRQDSDSKLELSTEEHVASYMNTQKVAAIIEHDFNNSWANAAHTRTDIPVTDADTQHDEDIMDDDNF